MCLVEEADRRVDERTPHRRTRQPPIKNAVSRPHNRPARPKRLPHHADPRPKVIPVLRKHARRARLAERRIERSHSAAAAKAKTHTHTATRH